MNSRYINQVSGYFANSLRWHVALERSVGTLCCHVVLERCAAYRDEFRTHTDRRANQSSMIQSVLSSISITIVALIIPIIDPTPRTHPSGQASYRLGKTPMQRHWRHFTLTRILRQLIKVTYVSSITALLVSITFLNISSLSQTK